MGLFRGGGEVGVGERSEGRNFRGMCVTWAREMRCATSGLRPVGGEITVTRASAERRARMRPAATWKGLCE